MRTLVALLALVLLAIALALYIGFDGSEGRAVGPAPRPVPTRPVPTRPVPTRPVPTREGETELADRDVPADTLEREVLEAVTQSEGDPETDATAAPSGTLMGRVVDDRRAPIEGADVALFLPERETLHVATGPDGRFRFEEVELPPTGNVYGGLLATLDGQAVYVWAADASYERKVEDLVLEPAHPAHVEVRDGGLPVTGADVVLEVGFERLLAGRGVTDANGRITFPSVPPGSRHVAAHKGARFGRAKKPATDPPERLLIADLAPTRGVDVIVRESESQEPVPGAIVSASQRVMPYKTFVSSFHTFVPEERPLDVPAVTTDADGLARLTGLPPERIVVQVDADGFRNRHDQPHEQRVEADASEVVFELTPHGYRTESLAARRCASSSSSPRARARRASSPTPFARTGAPPSRAN